MTTTTTFSGPETLDYGKTIEAGGWRVHRYAEGVEVTDIRRAGKRGARLAQFYIGHPWKPGISADAAEVFCRLARASATVEHMRAAFAILNAEHECGRESELRGVDVAPPAEDVVRVSNDSMALGITPRDFTARGLRDQNNEPTIICRGRASAAKLYRWALAHRDELATMTFAQFSTKLGELEVRSHYFCAVD